MNCDRLNFRKEHLKACGFIVIKKSEFSILFFDEYLKYAQNISILKDIENVTVKKNFQTFVEHRHDQSVLSLLSKKYKLQALGDPSQFGNIQINYFSNSKYSQILELPKRKKYAGVYRFIIRNIECFFIRVLKNEKNIK